MSRPLRDLFSGLLPPRRGLVEVITPRRTFADVVLPASTYRQLHQALAQIRYHDLIFQSWGLGERHDTGLGPDFNFAGPPGTGKTICAEAIAHDLGKALLVVRYAEMESMWVGETGKNVSSVFRGAIEQDAVLFFDEADAIASRRFTSVQQGVQREMNTVVNVLLRELDSFPGVVIFATNLAVNFDPAFERRIRTHILFEQPGVEEREQIWRVQIHPRKTPLAGDVDFRALAGRYEVSGGDIKNAVLKAAQMAALDGGDPQAKRIHQQHFESAMQEVLAAKRVMEQTLFAPEDANAQLQALAGAGGTMGQLTVRQDSLEDDLQTLATRLVQVEDHAETFAQALQQLAERGAADRQEVAVEVRGVLEHFQSEVRAAMERADAAREAADAARGSHTRTALYTAAAGVVLACIALLVALLT
jgi:SpoVK/Ycf46/Vps4 family AAA+-type ATPase